MAFQRVFMNVIICDGRVLFSIGIFATFCVTLVFEVCEYFECDIRRYLMFNFHYIVTYILLRDYCCISKYVCAHKVVFSLRGIVTSFWINLFSVTMVSDIIHNCRHISSIDKTRIKTSSLIFEFITFKNVESPKELQIAPNCSLCATLKIYRVISTKEIKQISSPNTNCVAISLYP